MRPRRLVLAGFSLRSGSGPRCRRALTALVEYGGLTDLELAGKLDMGRMGSRRGRQGVVESTETGGPRDPSRLPAAARQGLVPIAWSGRREADDGPAIPWMVDSVKLTLVVERDQ